jgi:DNA-directed RNA polymerase specialized sigma24 family protein
MTSLRHLYEDEMLSLKQIAEMTGMPMSRVRTQLIRAGVKIRSRAVGALLRKDAMARRRPRQKRRRM